jgi:hypothetical protein
MRTSPFNAHRVRVLVVAALAIGGASLFAFACNKQDTPPVYPLREETAVPEPGAIQPAVAESESEGSDADGGVPGDAGAAFGGLHLVQLDGGMPAPVPGAGAGAGADGGVPMAPGDAGMGAPIGDAGVMPPTFDGGMR